jgi:hypothetical protein
MFFGVLPFIVCVVLRYHYHDSIPWYVWLITLVMWLADWLRGLESKEYHEDYDWEREPQEEDG